jgi:hypothetical protein
MIKSKSVKKKTRSKVKKATLYNKVVDSKLYYYIMTILFISINSNKAYNSINDINDIFKKIKDITQDDKSDNIFKNIKNIIYEIRKNQMIINTMSIPIKIYFLKEILNKLFSLNKLNSKELTDSNIENIIDYTINNVSNKIANKDTETFKNLATNLALYEIYNNILKLK